MGRKGQRKERAMGPDEERHRIWQAMRRLPTFTSGDLVAVAEAGKDNVRKYCSALVKAEYVRLVRATVSGKAGGHAVYKLVKNTGPVAPRMTDGKVFDDNSTPPKPRPGDRPLVKTAPAMLKKLRELVDLADGDASEEQLLRAIDGARTLITQAEGRA